MARTAPPTALSVVGFSAAAVLWAHLAYNFAFSGDWMGPFRPGNAWDEGALDLANWGISLLGLARLREAAKAGGRLRARPGSTSRGLVNYSMLNIRHWSPPNPGSTGCPFPA